MLADDVINTTIGAGDWLNGEGWCLGVWCCHLRTPELKLLSAWRWHVWCDWVWHALVLFYSSSPPPQNPHTLLHCWFKCASYHVRELIKSSEHSVQAWWAEMYLWLHNTSNLEVDVDGLQQQKTTSDSWSRHEKESEVTVHTGLTETGQLKSANQKLTSFAEPVPAVAIHSFILSLSIVLCYFLVGGWLNDYTNELIFRCS